jgi:RNA polymerase sigma factor (TIGR02999 family)
MHATRLPELGQATGAANRAAIDDLFQLVYTELRVLARRQIARLNPGQTLSPTVLVHEAYVRLSDRARNSVRSEHHFRALAARVIRQLIIDYVRQRTAQKRGAGIALAELPDVGGPEAASIDDLLAIDQALVRLAALDRRQADIVELRFFGGLTVEESAVAMKLSERTVKREWQKARAFLSEALRAG